MLHSNAVLPIVEIRKHLINSWFRLLRIFVRYPVSEAPKGFAGQQFELSCDNPPIAVGSRLVHSLRHNKLKEYVRTSFTISKVSSDFHDDANNVALAETDASSAHICQRTHPQHLATDILALAVVWSEKPASAGLKHCEAATLERSSGDATPR